MSQYFLTCIFVLNGLSPDMARANGLQRFLGICMRDNALVLVGIFLWIHLSEESKGFMNVSLGSGGEIRGAGAFLGAGLRGALETTPLGWLS
jgi:hypothetical protein